ncbi:trp operon repressor [Vibrio maerlii]|uniref:trp operon repressor n=1 Tax=Vibrio maerlii TaxID=2231648 RepID=UPI000E3CACF5|nr:trp operon repressor [Vibrio maerlii]
MSEKPDYQQWQQIEELVKTAVEQGEHGFLLKLLMTPDERDALLARVNILSELLKGEMSQRQISQMLGVGVATITRGSNELKSKDEQQRTQLSALLNRGLEDSK